MVTFKRFSFITFLVGLHFSLFSQPQARIDSFETVIQQCLEVDSFSKAINNLNEVMDIYEYDGDWDNYYKSADRLLGYAKKSGDKSDLAEFNNKLGISSCLNGKNDKALEYFNKALEINTEIGNQQWISNSLENIGLVYKDLGEYQKALDYQMRSLKIREKENHPRLAETYSNISQLFEFIGEFDKQLEYIEKTKTIAKNHPDKHELQAIVCCELGEYYLDHGNQLDSSIIYFNHGLEHCKQVNWNRGIAVFLGDLAKAYYQKGDINKSIEMHLQSLDLSLKINDCMGICEEYNSLTELYVESEEFVRAKEMNKKAMEHSSRCKINFELQRAYKNAADLFRQTGNYMQAFTYYKQYHVLSDSLTGIEKHKTLVDLETKYETKKKEQQIELLATENRLKNQRLKTFVALTVALLLAVSIGIVLNILRQRKSKQREEDLKQKLLRSQMNPHFIFNALGSIQNYMYNNEQKKAAGYLGNFASLTRSILEKSSEELISLEDELNMLRNYIELERMRMKENFTYHIEVDENMETEFLAVPPMMMQPFVENAIKHGLKNKKDGGILTLSIKETEDNIIFVVEDNGCGLKASQNEKQKEHRSMSMQIFEDRKKLIEKKIKRKIKYSVEDLCCAESGREGTRVTIYFPQFEMV